MAAHFERPVVSRGNDSLHLTAGGLKIIGAFRLWGVNANRYQMCRK